MTLVSSDFMKPKKPNTLQSLKPNSPIFAAAFSFIPEMESVEAVEKILNYSFNDKNLLKEAITQTSCSNIESSNLFERLEFLGDSVFAVAFTNYLHLTYPNLNFDSKDLRKILNTNVSNENFARVAVKHNLHHYLILEDPDPNLDAQIKEFSEAVSKEVELAPFGGVVKAPKILADLVESIAGAVYIDVDFDMQRVWEIFRRLVEPIYTLDQVGEIPNLTVIRLLHLGDKLGKPIEFKSYKDNHKKNVFEVYLGDKRVGCGRATAVDTAKMFAAKEALYMLSMPVEKIVDEGNLEDEIEDAKKKLFEICSAEKVRLQTGSSSLPYEMTTDETVVDKGSLHVELEDVKRKLFEICATEKQAEDAEGIYSTRKLQIQIGSSSLSTTSVNPLTYEMPIKQVVGEGSPEIESKLKLSQICANNKWPDPIFSVEEELCSKKKGVEEEQVQRFVCSAKIEIPTVEGTFHMKGDAELTKNQAENSSAYYMIRALESSLISRVISNLQMQEVEAVEEKKISNYRSMNKNLLRKALTQMQEMKAMQEVKVVEKISNCSFTNKNLPTKELTQMEEVEAVEKILNYSFTNKNLLKEALTHSPCSPLLQRLNFVGMPALTLAFTNHVYLTYPKLEPNELDHLRIANIGQDKFARVVVKHGIYQFFRCKDPCSKREIKAFVKMMSIGNDPDPYRFEKYPKLLSDLVYSIAGAVYIDVNLDVKRLWEILRSLFEPLSTLDDLRQQPNIIHTLFGLGYRHGKRIEFRNRKSGDRSVITEVYLDDKYIACGKPDRCGGVSKLDAAKAALRELSKSMPFEMITNFNIEYEDAKEKLIGICHDRKLANPTFRFESFSKGYVFTVKIEASTEEDTISIKGHMRKRKKIAENNAASHMITVLNSSPLSIVIRSLHGEQSFVEKKKRKRYNRKINKSLEKERYLLSKKSEQQSLDENKTPQKRNSIDEDKNPQMQNSSDEDETLHQRKRKRRKICSTPSSSRLHSIAATT